MSEATSLGLKDTSMLTARLTLMITLAIGGTFLASGTAHADVRGACSDDGSTCTADVLPGLTCVRNGGLFVTTVCTNNTPKAYLVAMTTSCAGGEYSTPATFHSGGPGGGYYSGGSANHVDPEVKQDNIFVPASDSVTMPTGSCSLHASGVTFVAGPPPPPDTPPPAG